MLSLLTLLVTFAGGLLAITPIHLKPGALTNHLGEISLKVVSETLLRLLESINPSRIWETKANPDSNAQKFLNLLWDRLVFLHGKVDQANTDYSLHTIHSRVKRGLLNIFGKASKCLFGTATEDDIHDLREHYNHAAQNRRAINLNYRKIGILQSHLNKLLTSIANKALQRLNLLADFLPMDQTLHVLAAVLTSVLSVNDKVIANMIDAANSRVTPSLFPLHNLITIIDIGHRNYSFQPLYPSAMSQYCYPLLEASLTTDAIIVHVPFKPTEVFNAFKIIPFPFSVEDSVLTLDMSPSLVLIAKDYTSYSTSSYSDLNHCKSSFPYKYHCSASFLVFLPISGGVCEISLTRRNASDALSICPYKHLTSMPVFHMNFHGLHYFHFSKPFYNAVSCPEGTTYQQVTGHYAIAYACHVRSANIITYPSRIHVAFTASVTHRDFPP